MTKFIVNDCFTCAFYPVLQILFFGHEIVEYHCKHSNKKKLHILNVSSENDSNFTTAKIKSKFRFILLTVLLAYVYLNMQFVIFSFSESSSLSTRKIVSVFGMFGAISVIIYFLLDVTTTKYRCVYLQAIHCLLDKRYIYGFQTYLSKEYIKNWNRYFSRLRTFFLVYGVYNILDNIIRCFFTNVLQFGYIVVLGEFCLVQYHASGFATYHSLCKVFTDLFNQLYESIQYLHDQRTGKFIYKKQTFEISYESYSFEKHVANLIRMYNALHSTFRVFTNCCEKFMPSLWVSQLLLVTLQLYFVLKAPYLLNDYMVLVRSFQIHGAFIICLLFIRQFSQLENRVRS